MVQHRFRSRVSLRVFFALSTGLVSSLLGCSGDDLGKADNSANTAGSAGDSSATDVKHGTPSGGETSVEENGGNAGSGGQGGADNTGVGSRASGKGGATTEPEAGAAGKASPAAKCGDGEVTDEEVCDDGDRVNATGCLTDCSGCATGFHLVGTVCEAIIVACPKEDPCAPHGACDDSTGELVCECRKGYAGDTCGDCAKGYHNDDGTCVINEECKANSCGGNGLCDVVAGLVVCSCYGGYTGTSCSDCETGFHEVEGTCFVDETCTDTTCGDHGECDLVGGIIACTCSERYGGPRCRQCAARYHMSAGDCVPDQSCLDTSCNGHGGCSDEEGFVTCECDEGYTGEACDECLDGYHTTEDGTCALDEECGDDTCPANATCRVVEGLATCTCVAGYTGDDCTSCATGYHQAGGLCVVDDVCKASSCSGGGTCSIVEGLISCACDGKHTGNICQYCASGYVLKDGVCSVDITALDICASPQTAYSDCSKSYEGTVCYWDDGTGALVPYTCLEEDGWWAWFSSW